MCAAGAAPPNVHTYWPASGRKDNTCGSLISASCKGVGQLWTNGTQVNNAGPCPASGSGRAPWPGVAFRGEPDKEAAVVQKNPYLTALGAIALVSGFCTAATTAATS